MLVWLLSSHNIPQANERHRYPDNPFTVLHRDEPAPDTLLSDHHQSLANNHHYPAFLRQQQPTTSSGSSNESSEGREKVQARQKLSSSENSLLPVRTIIGSHVHDRPTRSLPPKPPAPVLRPSFQGFPRARFSTRQHRPPPHRSLARGSPRHQNLPHRTVPSDEWRTLFTRSASPLRQAYHAPDPSGSRAQQRAQTEPATPPHRLQHSHPPQSYIPTGAPKSLRASDNNAQLTHLHPPIRDLLHPSFQTSTTTRPTITIPHEAGTPPQSFRTVETIFPPSDVLSDFIRSTSKRRNLAIATETAAGQGQNIVALPGPLTTATLPWGDVVKLDEDEIAGAATVPVVGREQHGVDSASALPAVAGGTACSSDEAIGGVISLASARSAGRPQRSRKERVRSPSLKGPLEPSGFRDVYSEAMKTGLVPIAFVLKRRTRTEKKTAIPGQQHSNNDLSECGTGSSSDDSDDSFDRMMGGSLRCYPVYWSGVPKTPRGKTEKELQSVGIYTVTEVGRELDHREAGNQEEEKEKKEEGEEEKEEEEGEAEGKAYRSMSMRPTTVAGEEEGGGSDDGGKVETGGGEVAEGEEKWVWMNGLGDEG